MVSMFGDMEEMIGRMGDRTKIRCHLHPQQAEQQSAS